MSSNDIANTWKHSHVFDAGNPLGERSTRRVTFLTTIMMVIELVAGWRFHSMALVADGWHMSSHVIALGLSALGYFFARRYSSSPHFAFGTWKIEVLGGYTSAVLLVVIALTMCYGSVQRIFVPAEIRYDEAIAIGCLGLAVNLLSAWWLRGNHHHDHHDHAPAVHGHPHNHHQDLNLRSAYIHVAADAATSLLAILALTAGKIWNAPWWDPIIGIVGSVVVGVWAYKLIRDTARVLRCRDDCSGRRRNPRCDPPCTGQYRNLRSARLASR